MGKVDSEWGPRDFSGPIPPTCWFQAEATLRSQTNPVQCCNGGSNSCSELGICLAHLFLLPWKIPDHFPKDRGSQKEKVQGPMHGSVGEALEGAHWPRKGTVARLRQRP